MLKVRLQRVGRKNDPSFRVVVTDSRRGPKSRNYIELLGSYNPRQKHVSINGDRIKYWMGVGAQVSNTVHNILVNEKVIDKKKINVLPKKSPVVKEKEEKQPEVSTESTEASTKEKTGEQTPDGKDIKTEPESTQKEEIKSKEAVSTDADNTDKKSEEQKVLKSEEKKES